MGGKGVSKSYFFPHHFPPCLGLCFFIKAPKLASALDFLSATFQHQGFEYSFREAKSSLYFFCPIKTLTEVLGMEKLTVQCTLHSVHCTLGCSIPIGWNLVRADPVHCMAYRLLGGNDVKKQSQRTLGQ